MSFSHISIQKIIYMFISGLILGWLYLKTSSLWLTFVCSGCLNGMLAVLWIFRVNNESVYLEMIPKIALIAGIVGILCALCMFFIFGFKIERTETGLKRGEAVKAFFKSFALWIFIFITVFRFFFLYINRPNDEEDNYGKEPAESEPADETTASFKTADIYIINNLSFI